MIVSAVGERLSINSLSTKKASRAGMQATIILPQRARVSFLSVSVLFSSVLFMPIGKILFQKTTTTARIAASCTTYSNIPRKPCEKTDSSSGKNRSVKIKCPVLDTGNHSVIPSITPSKIILSISRKFINDSLQSFSLLYYKYTHFLYFCQ